MISELRFFAVDKQKNLENAKVTKQFIERNLVSTCKSCETREQAGELCTKLLGLYIQMGKLCSCLIG